MNKTDRLTDERLEELLQTTIAAPRGTQRDIATLIEEVRALRAEKGVAQSDKWDWDRKYRRALVLSLLEMLRDAEWCQECAVATDPLVAEVRAAFAGPARSDSQAAPND